MTTTSLNEFYVIGLSVRTRNKDQQMEHDIQNLWNDFMEKEVGQKIPNRLDDTLYGIYTDYENGVNGYYKAIVGCKVSSLENIPEGMTGITIKEGDYTKFMAKGDITKDAIPNAWETIWKTNLKRKFTTDFEVYDERAITQSKAEVDIFIAVY